MVRLAEQGQDPGGSFRVRVSFGDAAEYDVTVTDPADQDAEGRLAWYFEQHLRYPFLDKDLEHDAVQQITAHGEALFAQVFPGAASHDYRRLRDKSFDGCRIEISGSAALHRLHWETLKDPDLPAPLSVRLPVTRRVAGQGSKFDPHEDRPRGLHVSVRPIFTFWSDVPDAPVVPARVPAMPGAVCAWLVAFCPGCLFAGMFALPAW